MPDLISPSRAEELVMRKIPGAPVEKIPLKLAAGRILAVPLVADRPLPPYHRIMLDGIVFASADAPAERIWQAVGIHAAGAVDPPKLKPGQCWEIMTGASLPPDCDTIVPYEDAVRVEPGRFSVREEAIRPGFYIHREGSDFAAGDVLVPQHRAVDSRVAAVAATVGATHLAVLRRPSVAVFTTGDEVVPPERIPAPHQIRQSNAASLAATWRNLNADPLSPAHLADDPAATKAAIRERMDADVILLCGGISKGVHDYVRPVVESLLGAPAFHGIAQRPGKPLAFWPGPPAIFALPGNPMSVQICFHRYVVPFFRAIQKQPASRRIVELAAPFCFAPPLAYFLPVRLAQKGATLRARPLPLANSGDFASAIDSDGFIELPAGQTDFAEGFLAPFSEWL